MASGRGEERGGTTENEGKKKGGKEIAEVGFNDIEEGICAGGGCGDGQDGRCCISRGLFSLLSFLASELRLGSLGLCVVINGNLKQRELTISFFISLLAPPPPPPCVGPERFSSLAAAPSSSCASRERDESPSHTCASYDERRAGARLKRRARLFTLPSRRREKKYSKLFHTARGNCFEKIYFSLPPCPFFYALLLRTPRNAGVIEFFNYV